MSLEFNRRSFLKYSAAAAVAVAGSSLLTGCGEDEYQKTGSLGAKLKLMGTAQTYKTGAGAPTYDSTHHTFTCKINIECTTKKVPLCVMASNFELTVNPGDSEKNYAGDLVTVYPEEKDLTADEGAKDFTVTFKGTPTDLLEFKNGDKVEFKYWPRILASSGNSGYTRAFCTWKMTANVDDAGTVTFK